MQRRHILTQVYLDGTAGTYRLVLLFAVKLATFQPGLPARVSATALNRGSGCSGHSQLTEATVTQAASCQSA